MDWRLIVLTVMKIIDNKKDYYDYIQGVLGIDEKVTYDRRGSTNVGASELYHFDYPFRYDLYFCKKPFKDDGHKTKKSYWQSCKYENRANKYRWSWKNDRFVYEGKVLHLLLEIGYHRFIFEIERYLDEEDKLRLDTYIVEHKEVSKGNKKSKAPLYIAAYDFNYHSDGKTSMGIENPILKETWIPGLIPAQDMWNMLYEYISSLNDKDIVDTRTNDQHIESHGFDKKISFRHRK